MIIALFPNVHKEQAFEIAVTIREFLTKAGVSVVADDLHAKTLEVQPLSSVNMKDINFLISIGGDGSILSVFHTHKDLLAPVLGVNLGSLGFLADIPLQNLFPSLQELLNGEYTIDNRIFVKATTIHNESSFAINDIVVHRARNKKLIDLAIHVDGKYLNTFAADGVIVATPSGSTAYSLAAGGPILTPELEALVLTPISPHTISNRPIVLMPKQEIRIQYLSCEEPIDIIFDGIECFSMKPSEILTITKSQEHFSLVNLHSTDYFATLRTKLDWRGRLRH
ncbi:MAG: NAD(+)/NADH kinase [Chlamydiales bacterium]|nr:NAD(+)/NADH kinase [Chlamydiales bacterium]